ncbi:unknown protein [Spodoptera frugiperda multiple nucleopolyhedrovirus]|uniref:Ac78-like n=1 Tax=Spodoptera frugiperda nuclear polyhedrosis virus TaxID=10455 RepID=A1YJ73_NPVSF|nr:hypothetical protein SFMNPV_gp083 [Spodoptera frugiperda multiple nucleopolyhedrovirus]ABM45793.1 unknown protein [Spodoptera frugiperda multiple nucleopolyhedrovirus]ADV91316.1 hypothetical protein Sf83 [Spodoptera frugiperda multiple nucleopolyhedrovirus]AFH59027.1 hypothetical protein Sf83 [Spodoptera frugiperda multiple nucleopolyhedrovirus]QED40283.1 hypothetical protein [Spodoptera frugiperda multiple nucleopolyhedrovirus]QRN46195.1 Ac78-like [Spodoptera frugiperda multiple nucleopoly
MSLDVPYERLGTATKVDYIPLKLALTDLPSENTSDNNDDNQKNNNTQNPKIDINQSNANNYNQHQSVRSKQQFYDILVLGMLTVFCILVLLYAIYYFVILRDRQKSNTIRPSYMF